MYEIYVVTNVLNSKNYVGQTRLGHKKRWTVHKNAARTIDNYFYRAIRKHGHEAFVIEVVDTCPTQEEANMLEKEWVARLGSTDDQKGYNGTLGGDGSQPTLQTRLKSSATKKAMFQNPDFRAKMAAASVGKHHTEEGRRNIGKAQKGKQGNKDFRHNEETKAQIAATLKRLYAEGQKIPSRTPTTLGMKFGPMPEETKRKIAESVRKARAENPWSTRSKKSVQKIDTAR